MTPATVSSPPKIKSRRDVAVICLTCVSYMRLSGKRVVEGFGMPRGQPLSFLFTVPPKSWSIRSSSLSALDIKEEIRYASSLTTKPDVSLTEARKAVSIWASLLASDGSSSSLPRGLSAPLQAVCFGMYGFALSRTGQDEAAVRAFDVALSFPLLDGTDRQSRREVQVGRARALQRLQRYRNASDAYQQAGRAYRSEAMTCLLRLGDVATVLSTLQEQEKKDPSPSHQAEESAMMATLSWLQQEPQEEQMKNGRRISFSNEKLVDMVWFAATSKSSLSSYLRLLYRWIYNVMTRSTTQNGKHRMRRPPQTFTKKGRQQKDILLDLAYLNSQTPYDDPWLIHLDDKVWLHQLLSHSNNATMTKSFWPLSFVLPTDLSRLPAGNNNGWILKHRTGYGSHGNQIVASTKEIEHYWTTHHSWREERSAPEKEEEEAFVLCQEIVHPPYLLQGCRFSMRVYVVYFAASATDPLQVYVHQSGLIKLASKKTQETTVLDEDAVMTNSARQQQGQGNDKDATELQLDFAFLQQHLGPESFQTLLNRIHDIVRNVMALWDQKRAFLPLEQKAQPPPSPPPSVGRLQLAKILGFDFVVQEEKNPWLVEVNRFPGLEPRNATFGVEASVKQTVVRDAWILACAKIGFSSQQVLQLDPDPSLSDAPRLVRVL